MTAAGRRGGGAGSGAGRRVLGGPLVVAVAVLAVLAASGAVSSRSSPTSSAHASSTSDPARSASSASSTSTSTSSTSTTATSTTLPPPVVLAGSAQGGRAAFLGPVMRVPVEVWPGGTAPAGPGTPATEPMLGIGYRQFGAGPPLVMIAGQDASMSLWDPRLLARLAQHYRVTIFDLPGVGYSVDPFESLPPMTVPWLAQETYRFFVAIGADRPLILGWGLGGAVALALAERHPHVPAALVLVGTSAGGTAAVRPSPAVSAALDSPDITTIGLSDLLFPPEASAARRAFVAAVASEKPDDLVAPAISSEARAERQLLGDDAIYDRLGRVLAPVLIVQGVEDEVSPAANLPALRGRLRNARELVYVHAGSGVLFEDAPAIVQAIENFTT